MYHSVYARIATPDTEDGATAVYTDAEAGMHDLFGTDATFIEVALCPAGEVEPEPGEPDRDEVEINFATYLDTRKIEVRLDTLVERLRAYAPDAELILLDVS